MELRSAQLAIPQMGEILTFEQQTRSRIVALQPVDVPAELEPDQLRMLDDLEARLGDVVLVAFRSEPEHDPFDMSSATAVIPHGFKKLSPRQLTHLQTWERNWSVVLLCYEPERPSIPNTKGKRP